MKYTNYLINGNFINIEQITKNKYLRPITVPTGIAVSFAGIFLIGGAIPLAVVFDTGRSVKLAYYKLVKKYYIHKHYDNVFNSLSIRHMQKIKMQIAIKNINIFDKARIRHIILYPDLIFIQSIRNFKDIEKKLFNF